MKSYEETTESVFRRSNAFIKKRAERRKTMRLITSVLSCFLLVAFIGVGALSGIFNRIPYDIPDAGTLQNQTVESGNTQPSQGSYSENSSSGETQGNSDNKTHISPDDPSIIWAEEIGMSGDMVSPFDWNGKLIGNDLYEAFKRYSDDTVFAISVQATYGENLEYLQYVYNGKTLVEYQKEAEEEGELSIKLAELLKSGDYLKYGEALYKTGNDKGQKWSKERYDSEVAYIGEELLSKYIIDGEFLREKLEYDLSQSETVTAQTAYLEAYCAACYEYENYIIGQTKEQLTEQGIVLESKNAVYTHKELKGSAVNISSEDAYISIERNKPYLIIYVTQEEFASLAGNYEFNIFNLADENARNGVYPFGQADVDLPTDLIN